jgi:hypothetical protein
MQHFISLIFEVYDQKTKYIETQIDIHVQHFPH